MVTIDMEINLDLISKQCPTAYSLCKFSLGEKIHDEEAILDWMREKNLRIKICLNVLNKNWFYEVFLRPKNRNYVRKHGIVESFEEAWSDSMLEAWLLLEYEVKPKKESHTILDAVTAKTIRRAQQLKFMKQEAMKKVAQERRAIEQKRRDEEKQEREDNKNKQ